MDFLWFLEGIRTPVGNEFFQFVTYFGQEMLLLSVICIFYWCLDKKLAVQLGLTYFAAGLFVQSLKITFRIPRPWVLDPDFHAVESAVPAATGYSFPSGHTQGGTCLFAPLAMREKRPWLRFLLTAAFLLIGFSRMYLGVHTPKDVFAAMGISLFFSYLICRCRDILPDNPKGVRLLSAVLLFLSLLTAAYALWHLHFNGLPQKYASDCLKASGAGLGFAAGFCLERTFLDFTVRTRTLKGQLCKLFAGLSGTLFLKTALSSILGENLILKGLEYAFLVFWILFLYPYLFTALQNRRKKRYRI